VAEHLSRCGLNLPSGTGLTREQVERVAHALAEALEARSIP
jgi:dTDP-4-amino-4,6-dideoxygalactose transaminase